MGDDVTRKRARRFGDRYDGRRLRSLDPIYQMIPYGMRTRVDAQDCFEDRIDIGPAEGWLRRQRASPFHASAFVTDLGSLGIGPIYHHLYEFGTVSIFLAFGAKEREHALGGDGRVEQDQD